jgi:hydroxyacylglutathione hydrolase
MKSWITKSGQRTYQVLEGICNCFLISYRDRYLLVDSGRENRWKDLSKELDGLGVNDRSLMALILTHSHFDHAENAANVKKKFKTTIIVLKNEADYLQWR